MFLLHGGGAAVRRRDDKKAASAAELESVSDSSRRAIRGRLGAPSRIRQWHRAGPCSARQASWQRRSLAAKRAVGRELAKAVTCGRPNGLAPLPADRYATMAAPANGRDALSIGESALAAATAAHYLVGRPTWHPNLLAAFCHTRLPMLISSRIVAGGLPATHAAHASRWRRRRASERARRLRNARNSKATKGPVGLGVAAFGRPASAAGANRERHTRPRAGRDPIRVSARPRKATLSNIATRLCVPL
jgi:hypothetical protein